MRKKLLAGLTIGFFMLGIAVIANATLWDRGNGLIYDDVLNITWLQDANYAMTSNYDPDGEIHWQDAMDWVDQLTYGGMMIGGFLRLLIIWMEVDLIEVT